MRPSGRKSLHYGRKDIGLLKLLSVPKDQSPLVIILSNEIRSVGNLIVKHCIPEQLPGVAVQRGFHADSHDILFN